MGWWGFFFHGLVCICFGIMHHLCFIIAINVESDSGSVKKEKEKKNRKKDKENGSGSGDAGNHNDIDAPEAVVRGFFIFIF